MRHNSCMYLVGELEVFGRWDISWAMCIFTLMRVQRNLLNGEGILESEFASLLLF